MNLLRGGLTALVALSMNAAAEPVTIRFDGGEVPVSSATFEHRGARFSGGRIATEGAPGLYASGAFYYDVTGKASGIAASGAREVTFSTAATGVRFFFVHGFGHDAGTARAFDAEGNLVGTVESRRATYFGAPSNFASFDTATPIAKIAFDGGLVDDFTFEASADGFAATTALNGSWVNVSTDPPLDGQGLLIEYAPESRTLFVAWFTYGTNGQRWLTAQGELVDGAASLTIVETTGGTFNAASGIQRRDVGTMTATFTACDRGTIGFALPDEGRSGTFAIRRLRSIFAGDGACSRSS